MSHLHVMRMLHDIVLESAKPAKQLAKEIGKPYSTLLREINPYDTGAKLGVETMLKLVKATGNVTPLQAMARELGYEMVPLQQAREHGDYSLLDVHTPFSPVRGEEVA
jgi:hypothetical protein